MIVYGIVRKDDPERKLIKSRRGHFAWETTQAAGAARAYMPKTVWEYEPNGRESLAHCEYEVVACELVEVKP